MYPAQPLYARRTLTNPKYLPVLRAQWPWQILFPALCRLERYILFPSRRWARCLLSVIPSIVLLSIERCLYAPVAFLLSYPFFSAPFQWRIAVASQILTGEDPVNAVVGLPASAADCRGFPLLLFDARRAGAKEYFETFSAEDCVQVDSLARVSALPISASFLNGPFAADQLENS